MTTKLKTPEEIHDWIHEALEIGMDPLESRLGLFLRQFDR